tara:strand:+ start:312 stop:1088 length:777 start_codon:yes stop_codon:yes gene_type:complete
MGKKIIYYYQTFVGLKDILNNDTKVTNIHLSAFHFGTDEQGNPYIHLNDFPPDSQKFNDVWEDIEKAKSLGIKIIIMLGGAGGAYTDLFSNFDVYYKFLKDFIQDKRDVIDGIDLDIEEYVELSKIENLIKLIKKDFGQDFIISMAPVQYAIETDNPGMGGFVYKTLYKSCGELIDYFNVQCYENYTLLAYENMLNNDYPKDKIIMGSISCQDINQNLETIKSIVKKYPDFLGVFNWEYFDSPPKPGEWSQLMFNALN